MPKFDIYSNVVLIDNHIKASAGETGRVISKASINGIDMVEVQFDSGVQCFCKAEILDNNDPETLIQSTLEPVQLTSAERASMLAKRVIDKKLNYRLSLLQQQEKEYKERLASIAEKVSSIKALEKSLHTSAKKLVKVKQLQDNAIVLQLENEANSKVF